MKLSYVKRGNELLSEQVEDNCWVFTGISGALAPVTAEEKPGGRTSAFLRKFSMNFSYPLKRCW